LGALCEGLVIAPRAATGADSDSDQPEVQTYRWFEVFKGKVKDKDKESTSDKKAREAAVRFLEGLKAKKLDELKKSAAVPWLDGGERVLEEEKELAKSLQKTLDTPALTKAALEVGGVASYSDARKLILEEQGRKLIDKVLKKEDKIVLVVSKEPALWYVLVKMGDAPRVVGGPHRLTYLLVGNKLPEDAAAALEKADEIHLY